MRYDVVIIGGGKAGLTAGLELQKAGKHTLVVAAGLSLNQTPRAEYLAQGGTILPGDAVVSGEFEKGKLLAVRTEKLGQTLIQADSFILCTGKYFGKGLATDMDKVYETVFGCDVDYIADRSAWVNPDFFAPQPFMAFGVKTDEKGRVSIGGATVENLYAAGEILAGDVDIEKSALEVCRNLI